MTTAQSSRARRLPADRFAAFVLANGRTYPTRDVAGDDFTDFLANACQRCPHRSTLVIRRTDACGAVTLHVHAIRRQSRPVSLHADHQTRRINPLYAEHLHDLHLGELMEAMA